MTAICQLRTIPRSDKQWISSASRLPGVHWYARKWSSEMVSSRHVGQLSREETASKWADLRRSRRCMYMALRQQGIP